MFKAPDLIELALGFGLLVATTQSVKYRDCADQRPWAWDDVAIGALIGAGIFGAARAGLSIYFVAGLLAFVLFFGLWLDAVLFRIFTIELGMGGLGGVVLSLMFVELSQLSRARQFFADNLLFAIFPAAVAAIILRILLPPDSILRIATGITLLIYFALMYRGRVRKTRPRSFALRYFFVARPPPNTTSFVPRKEHAGLLEPTRRPSPPSPRHGILSGAPIILFSFESAGRDHTHTPWLTELAPKSVRSRNHFCISPTTNNAHRCLYEKQSLAPLLQAGYQTIYLSAVKTKYFGLQPILSEAGFETILDGTKIPEDDYALLDQGLKLLAELPRDKPIFLHVHATNTHVPYRVVDRARFNRHDHADDRGRFLNGLEETDFIFASLYEQLIARELVRDPLLIVTSDHGQSFGELGFHSHGSAVTKEQITVPFLLHHSRLAPEEIAWSSHLDIVPTILDLLGINNATPVEGASIFHPPRTPELLLWAGHPSRSTTTNYGMIHGLEKFMVDLIRDRCYRMDWNDHDLRELEPAEKEYYSVLLSKMMISRGIK